LPVGAIGGSRALMAEIAPAGPVYQAGTLSGNPLAMAAGRATLHELAKPGAYERLETISERLCASLREACQEASVPAQVNAVGSMWTLFFSDGPVFDAASARRADRARFGRFFHAMLERGVYLPPSQFEAAFVSLAHGEVEVDAIVAAARESLRELV
jgi:glutamate-1-semialdehyde 2,1-aminomutase